MYALVPVPAVRTHVPNTLSQNLRDWQILYDDWTCNGLYQPDQGVAGINPLVRKAPRPVPDEEFQHGFAQTFPLIRRRAGDPRQGAVAGRQLSAGLPHGHDEQEVGAVPGRIESLRIGQIVVDPQRHIGRLLHVRPPGMKLSSFRRSVRIVKVSMSEPTA